MAPASPVVSIVVPVRDGERFLDAALLSARQQTFSDIELIVVDDGSVDGTPEIARRHAAEDSRMRVVQAAGRGVAAARNQGISLARGTYIAPLDADDLWSSTKLEQQVRRFDELGEEVALVYSWTCLIDGDDRVLGMSRPFDDATMRTMEGDVLLPLVYKSFLANGTNPLIRRRCLEEVGGYDESLSRREDWDLSLRLAGRWSFALVPATLAAYRQLPASRSHGAPELLESHARILGRLEQEHPGLPRVLLRWSRSECFAWAAARAHGAGDAKAAITLLAKAVVLDPGQLARPGPWQPLLRRIGGRKPNPPIDGGWDAIPTRSQAAVPTPFSLMEQRRVRRLRRWRAAMRSGRP